MQMHDVIFRRECNLCEAGFLALLTLKMRAARAVSRSKRASGSCTSLVHRVRLMVLKGQIHLRYNSFSREQNNFKKTPELKMRKRLQRG